MKEQSDKEKFKNDFKKRLYAFTLRLIQFLDALPSDMVSKRIGDQLLRSGTSILGNYVEGQSASSKRDFTNFFNHSLKSANESKLWVAILRDTSRFDAKVADELLKELDEIAKIFASSILTLKNKR